MYVTMSKGKGKKTKKKSRNDRWVNSKNIKETKAGQVGEVRRSNNVKKTIAASSKHQSVDDQDPMTKVRFENIAAERLQQNNEHNKNETQIDATVNLQQNHIAQLTKRNEDLEKKLKHQEEKYEEIKTTKEKCIDNLEKTKRALTDKIKEQNDKITSLENECTKCTAKNAELTQLRSKLAKELEQQEDKYQLMLSERDKQIKHIDNETRKIKITLKERGASITKSNDAIKNLNGQNIELEQEIAKLKKGISKMETESQQFNSILSEKHNQIESLMTKNKNLEEEKQDALRRLSAMMSVKLRDNNPNIADLSDQFRPTKLGEQFSELYDNEWTDAFDALQNNFEEKHVISILLDIVMESYQFCDQQLIEVWAIAENWFIDKDATTAQQISKTLKDGRKQKVIGRVEDIQQKYTGYLLKVCNTEHLDKLITSDPLRNYISTCVRLALLMTANDPPVVIECPGWQRFTERPYPRDTVPHSSPNYGLTPEELNNDKENKSTSNTIDDTHLIATEIKMKSREAEKVDNIFSHQFEHMDGTLSIPVKNDAMNTMSNHSVVDKTQTNGSSRLYLEDDIEEQINRPDKSKEHGQESNNLSKMESGLDASLDVNVNFTPTDNIPEMLSNKINDTGNQYDVQTVEVRNDKPQPNKGSKDAPVSDISNAESKQHHDADGHSGGPQEPHNSDTELTEKETSLYDKRIRGPEQTSNGVGNKNKIVLTNNERTFGTVSSQSQVVNSPTYTDPNRGAPRDITVKNELPDSTPTTPFNFIDDGLCQQMVNLSINVKNEAHQENKTGNAAQGDVVEDETFDTKDGTWEGLSDEESGQHHDADGHTDESPEPLKSAAKVTKTEGSFNVKRIEKSEQTDNNAMTANEIDPIECNVVTDIAQNQAAVDNPTSTNPIQDLQTDEFFSIQLPDIPVEGACEDGSGQDQAVEDDIVDDQIIDSTISNTNDGSLAGAFDVKFATETENSQYESNEAQKKIERPFFDKDKYKEYTSRGPYVDYFVWPIIYLHRDGPMLGKGIAQGSKDKMVDGINTLLVSWKTRP